MSKMWMNFAMVNVVESLCQGKFGWKETWCTTSGSGKVALWRVFLGLNFSTECGAGVCQKCVSLLWLFRDFWPHFLVRVRWNWQPVFWKTVKMNGWGLGVVLSCQKFWSWNFSSVWLVVEKLVFGGGEKNCVFESAWKCCKCENLWKIVFTVGSVWVDCFESKNGLKSWDIAKVI